MMRDDGDEGEDADADAGGDEVDGRDLSWDDLADAPLEVDPSDPICSPCDDDAVVDSDGQEFQVARGVAAPKAPSKEVQARHNLTHLPYASWCPWCHGTEAECSSSPIQGRIGSLSPSTCNGLLFRP